MRLASLTDPAQREKETHAADAAARRHLAVLAFQRFHMVDLAREMSRLGWRVSLYTALPRSRVADSEAASVHVALGWNTLRLLAVRTGRFGWHVPARLLGPIERRAQREFTAFARQRLAEVEVVDALSGWGLEAGTSVQQGGGRYLCNRGSAHIEWQRQVLREEHDRLGIPQPDWLPQWAIERELAEYAAADAILVPSTFARDTFLARGVPWGKIRVCTLAADLELFRPGVAEQRVFRILFVGTASVRKGIHYLFDAVRPLVEKGAAEVWLIGAVSREARPILARNAHLFYHQAFVSPSRLAELYRQGSVLVLPSVEDGFGLVLPQAMASGIPVIASAHTGAADLFTDGREGFLVPARDALAIRERMEWLLDHPHERENMGNAARARVVALGGWRGYGERVERVYLELLARD